MSVCWLDLLVSLEFTHYHLFWCFVIIYLLLEDGPYVNPIDLLEEGNIDIARLEGGGSCGELALREGKPRMATLKCLKRTHFLIINKSLY